MQIDRISLTNFRSFGPKGHKLTLTPGITTLVGANGSGKTALMTALARLFGVTAAQRTGQRRDFHVAHDQQDLESGASLAIDVLFSFPELAGGKAAKPGAVPAFFRHMSASGKGQPLMARIRLQAVWTEDGTPDGTIQEDVRWITTLDNSFDWDTCKSVAPIERASIQLIYVPAARTGSEPQGPALEGRAMVARPQDDGRDRLSEHPESLRQGTAGRVHRRTPQAPLAAGARSRHRHQAAVAKHGPRLRSTTLKDAIKSH